MKAFARKILMFFGLFLTVGMVMGLLVLALGILGLLPVVGLTLFYGWVLFAYLHYRQTRQAELLHVLTTAADGGMPLADALRAYLLDRPHSMQHECWIASIQFFLLPGYYWVWHRGHSFDRKIERLIDLVEQGVALDEALGKVPALTSSQARLLVKVGLSTGQLATCLRCAAPNRIVPVWMEVVPRAAYPLALLIVVLGIVSFQRVFILPKFQKIFADFGMELPLLTRRLFAFADMVVNHAWIIALLIPTLVALGAALLSSTTASWFCPGVGRLYRMYIRGRVLNALGVLLQAGKPAPAALELLAGADAFTGSVWRRLNASRSAVEQGTPLPDALFGTGLLSRSMVPLVRAAERARSLPWALGELGEAASKRTVQLMRRISQTVFPIVVVAMGLLIGFIVVALFMPMVAVMLELAR